MPSDTSGSAARKARSTRRVTWPLRSRQQGTPHPKTLDNLSANLGQVSTVAVQRLSTSLPWFSQLRADERSELGLLAQRGIASFVRWYENPQEPVWVLTEIFKQAPTELTRSITLQNALQVLRIVVDVVEEKVPELAQHNDEVALREATPIDPPARPMPTPASTSRPGSGRSSCSRPMPVGRPVPRCGAVSAASPGCSP